MDDLRKAAAECLQLLANGKGQPTTEEMQAIVSKLDAAMKPMTVETAADELRRRREEGQ